MFDRRHIINITMEKPIQNKIDIAVGYDIFSRFMLDK